MIHPKTIAEAQAYRYGTWAGNPNGNLYRKNYCAYEIFDRWVSYQCSKKNGKGVNGLYCGIHAKKVKL